MRGSRRREDGSKSPSRHGTRRSSTSLSEEGVPSRHCEIRLSTRKKSVWQMPQSTTHHGVTSFPTQRFKPPCSLDSHRGEKLLAHTLRAVGQGAAPCVKIQRSPTGTWRSVAHSNGPSQSITQFRSV